MQFEITQETFGDALGVVGRAVPAKSTLPVLSNVLLDAREDGTLVVVGNNLELAVRHAVKCTVDRPGGITLPARLLADYVSLLDQKSPILFELNPKTHKVHLSCGASEANIAGIDADDFPPIPDVNIGATIELPASVLKEAIDAVVFAAAADDSRPVLAGVLVRTNKGVLTLAAADGFRLAVREVEIDPNTPDEVVIVPAKTLVEVGRLVPDGDDVNVQVTIGPKGNHVVFAFGDTQVTSRVIEGQFPDYQRIIPTGYTTNVTLATNALLRAARAANVFARDNSNIVRLEFLALSDRESGDPRGELHVRSTSAEFGDNDGALDCEVDEDTQIAFNGRYLRDALEAIGSERVRIGLTGPASPGVLRPVATNGHDGGVLYVIMPMHVAR